jgi:hypothetical protein
VGAEIARPYLVGLLAEVHEAAGEIEPTLAILAAAEVARATRELRYEPGILRPESELLLRQSITDRRGHRPARGQPPGAGRRLRRRANRAAER